MVELVERFAIALQRHRERAEEAPAFEAESTTSFEERPLPVALQPFGFDEPTNDEAGDDESAPDFDCAAALSRNREAFAAAPVASDSGIDALEEDFEETAEAEYTSLLAMKSPLGGAREPVRIDAADSDEDDGENDFAEPVVAFPGHAARRAAPGSGADSPQSFDAPLARAERAVARGPLASPIARETGETEQALRDALEKLQKLSGVG
jgi:hypothetical protein